MIEMNERDELEALDQALDALVGRDPKSLKELLVTFPDQSELLRSVQAAGKAHGALATSVRPETKARHMSVLMDAARNGSPQKVVVPSKARLRRLLRPITVLAIVASIGLTPAVALAKSSQPGEALYGTKLAFENFQLVVSMDPADDVRLHIQFAARRLEELSELIGEGRTDNIGHALSNFESHANAAGDEVDELAVEGSDVGELSEDLATVLEKHITVLEGLAAAAGCVEGDEDAGKPQCKGLLNAIENSSKVLDEHPGLGSEKSNGKSGERGRPEEPGKPADTGKPAELPKQSSTPTESRRPTGTGRR